MSRTSKSLASSYMQKHQLRKWLADLLAEVAEAQPLNPKSFMRHSISRALEEAEKVETSEPPKLSDRSELEIVIETFIDGQKTTNDLRRISSNAELRATDMSAWFEEALSTFLNGVAPLTNKDGVSRLRVVRNLKETRIQEQFFQKHKIKELMEEWVQDLVSVQPENPRKYICEQLSSQISDISNKHVKSAADQLFRMTIRCTVFGEGSHRELLKEGPPSFQWPNWKVWVEEAVTELYFGLLPLLIRSNFFSFTFAWDNAEEVAGSDQQLLSEGTTECDIDIAVEEYHSKFSQDPDFSGRTGAFANIDVYDKGIDGVVGPMDVNPLRAMFSEHCLSADADTPFKPPNSQKTTTPREEWVFVVGEAGVDKAQWILKHASSSSSVAEDGTKRNRKTIQELSAHAIAKESGLSDMEIVALRLYTGPCYALYNRVLRKKPMTSNLFSTTIHLIVCGLYKLCRVSKPPEDHVLYRGMAQTALPKHFFEMDDQGFSGGTELGFMSTTSDPEVAVEYSGISKDKALPTIFKIELGKTSVGSDVSWLSQFEGEREYLFPPLTHLQIRGRPVLEKGLSVITLHVTVNQQFMSLEDVLASRKRGLESLVTSLMWDLRHEAIKEGKMGQHSPLIGQLEDKLLQQVKSQSPDHYNLNWKYKQAMNTLLDSAKVGKEQIIVGKVIPDSTLPTKGAVPEPLSADPAVADTQDHNPERSSDYANHGDKGLQDDVSELHSKFMQDPSFTGRVGAFEGMLEFDKGIYDRVGTMDVQPLRAMYAEHVLSPDSDMEFKAPNATEVTTPKKEWEFVLGEDGVDTESWTVRPGSVPAIKVSMSRGRNAKPLSELMAHPKAAGLSMMEIIALRLYTGPLYILYNQVLRGNSRTKSTFSTTINLIMSALVHQCRVSRPPADHTLYRGMGSVALPPRFFDQDSQGFAGGTELGFMSTTSNMQVALEYSGRDRGKTLPTLFRIEFSKTSVGAEISWLSQFESESEFLYPPLTHLQVEGQPLLEDGLSIITLRPTLHQKFLPFSKVVSLRRDRLLDLSASLVWDVRHWAARESVLLQYKTFIDGMRQTLQDFILSQEAVSYNDTTTYSQKFNSLMELYEDKCFELCDLIWREGCTVQEQGDLLQADNSFSTAFSVLKELCSRAKKIRERRQELKRAWLKNREAGGFTDLQIAAGRHELGNELCGQGQLKEAVHLLQSAISLYEKCDKKNQANAMNDLAIALSELGDYEQAIKVFHQCIEAKRSYYGEENISLAHTIQSLGGEYQHVSDYDNALKFHHEGLEIISRIRGKDHPETIKAKWGMGMVKFHQMKYEEGLPVLLEVLQAYRDTTGVQSVKAAQLLHNIAMCCRGLERYDEALMYYKESLKIKTQTLGSKHADVAMTIMNMGFIYKIRKEYELAMRSYESSLSIQKACFGERHMQVAMSLDNMSMVLREQGQNDKALDYGLQALSIFEEQLGPDHNSMRICRNSLASTYAALKRPQDAEAQYREMIRIEFKLFGAEHPQVAATYISLVRVLWQQAKHREIQESTDEAVKILEKAPGDNRLAIADAIRWKGNAFLAAEENVEAVTAYKQAMDIFVSVRGQTHLDVGITASNIGLALKRLERTPEASEMYQVAAVAYEGAYGADDPRTLAMKNEVEGLTSGDTEASGGPGNGQS